MPRDTTLSSGFTTQQAAARQSMRAFAPSTVQQRRTVFFFCHESQSAVCLQGAGVKLRLVRRRASLGLSKSIVRLAPRGKIPGKSTASVFIFGQAGASDFIEHRDEARRRRYLARACQNRDKRGGSHATTRLPPTSGASTCCGRGHTQSVQPGTTSQCWNWAAIGPEADAAANVGAICVVSATLTRIVRLPLTSCPLTSYCGYPLPVTDSYP
jgi:hypothetical protein